MAKRNVEAYLKHVDHFGPDGVGEVVERDRELSDEEKRAVLAYIALKISSKRKKRT